MVIQRSEIWWAALPDPVGSEPGMRRPVLIVQSNEFNHSRIQTVIVVTITSNLKLADAPGNVLLPKRESKLPLDSVANVSQVVTLDKSLLTKRVGSLLPTFMEQVNAGLKLVLNLYAS
ncbi:MAG: type II toxin-antitoxin system PemK/MazF family toxin [Chloroflexi bacterium]|nr:type II toxin-antitoxin system PemK/MazF family toxin [Chloroflexota bacterium]